MSGRWLATIADGSYPPGSSVVTWDRTGRNGQRLAPGYYEILGTIGSIRVRDRLVLVP
jgi:flagellar hook assembly protein FlgD